jgi:hypothetical protein
MIMLLKLKRVWKNNMGIKFMARKFFVLDIAL